MVNQTPCPFVNMLLTEKLINNKNTRGKDIRHIKKLEHDVSMFRLDKYNGDYVSFNPKLFKQLKRKSADKKYITLDDFIEFKRERMLYCQKKTTLN
jgi:hypothetical protein